MYQSSIQQYKKGVTIVKKFTVLLFNALFVASLVFLTALAARAQTEVQTDLIITVKTDKPAYAFREKITVTLEAENLSGEDKVLAFSTGCQMGFDVKQFLVDTNNYTLPVLNDILYPRNCSQAQTTITIPNNKKAVWTRYIDSSEEGGPELLPGEYLLHAFIVDYENESWSIEKTSYAKFSVGFPLSGEGVKCSDTVICINAYTCAYKGLFEDNAEGMCIDVGSVDANLPESLLCTGTGGQFSAETGCACATSYSWSSKAGCTKSVLLDELCISTGGIVANNSEMRCLCEDQKQWDTLQGCREIKQISFNDIAGHWAQEYILKLAEKGVVTGYADGGFHPDTDISRAEMVKMSLYAAGIPSADPNADPEFTFTDVTGWEVEWVYAAWKNNIVTGYSSELFAPAKQVTRAEALKIAMLAFKVDIPDTLSEWAFEDTIGHWALSYINKAYLDFIISGYADNNFHPDDPIKRAEVAKIIQLLSEK
ncbi:S-layer homology domain-containing protein [Candidatus Peregrinibacteria bacterium]|nr:S-layer homology domain-containing protein [Candidatus Peregrinibacteria bacterium]